MISKTELNEVKNKKNTSLYYEEKEYLQYIFLKAISRFADIFTFKGGTCLRICYGLERASEDLDFNADISIKAIKKTTYGCLKDFDLLNINHEIYSEKEYKGNYRIEIRFEGPLFNGSKSSTNTLKIDFNRKKVRDKAAKVIPRLFSDVPVFTIVVLDEKEILAEKIRALVNRSQPRDMYDVWMLINNRVKIDKSILIEKLKEEKSNLSQLTFPSKKEYERDLKVLLNYLPPYEQVKLDVERSIKTLRASIRS